MNSIRDAHRINSQRDHWFLQYIKNYCLEINPSRSTSACLNRSSSSQLSVLAFLLLPDCLFTFLTITMASYRERNPLLFLSNQSKNRWTVCRISSSSILTELLVVVLSPFPLFLISLEAQSPICLQNYYKHSKQTFLLFLTSVRLLTTVCLNFVAAISYCVLSSKQFDENNDNRCLDLLSLRFENSTTFYTCFNWGLMSANSLQQMCHNRGVLLIFGILRVRNKKHSIKQTSLNRINQPKETLYPNHTLIFQSKEISNSLKIDLDFVWLYHNQEKSNQKKQEGFSHSETCFSELVTNSEVEITNLYVLT